MSLLVPSPQFTADIVETVLGVGKTERVGRLPVACLAALVAHASLVLTLHRVARVPGQASATAPTQPPPQEYEIDIATISPSVSAKTQPEQLAAERRSVRTRVRDALVARTRVSETKAAQAATVVAQQPDPNVPVDLTAEAVVTGTARSYWGGVTARGGTSTSAVPEKPSAGAQGPALLAPAAPDRSNPVSLESENWSCPWPREADAQQIDEQTVILRVVVRADGAVEAATVLTDPGHGFGSAAAACAAGTRFTPACNRNGQPVRATSPPIRVRFTR